MAKLSFVIPIYNAGNYIKRCLNSISQQKIDDYEIVVVNDGSTDNTHQILEDLGEVYPQLKVINKRNGGVSSARNVGIDNATGDWIMFVDADDYLLPDSLTDITKSLPGNDCDLFLVSMRRISRDNTVSDNHLNDGVFTSDAILDFILTTDTLSLGAPWNKLYRTEIIKKYRIRFDESTILFEDICFNYKYLRHCNKITRLSDLVYCYDVNSQSATSKFHGEIFRNDLTKYLQTEKETISEIVHQINTQNKGAINSLISQIHAHTTKTAIHNCLYELYGMYRDRTLKNKDKKKQTREMIAFMKSLDPEWQNCLNVGFPHIFASVARKSPLMAHYLLKSVFLIKSLK